MFTAILCFACVDPLLGKPTLQGATLSIAPNAAVTFSGGMSALHTDGRIVIPQDVLVDDGAELQLPLSMNQVGPTFRRLPSIDLDDRILFRQHDLGLYLFPWQNMSRYAAGR